MPSFPRLRADAARNRESLLAVATRAFASADTKPSMTAIAREAGVGVGTLYRHFPTRESLVDAVYQDQAERLSAGARELLENLPPAEAMRRWMDLFADWLATKRGMLALLALDLSETGHPPSRSEMLAAITTILDAGAAAGDIRCDVDPEDIVASLVGIFTVAGNPVQRVQASRLLDLLMDGLKPSHARLGSVGDTKPGSAALVGRFCPAEREDQPPEQVKSDRWRRSRPAVRRPPSRCMMTRRSDWTPWTSFLMTSERFLMRGSPITSSLRQITRSDDRTTRGQNRSCSRR